jgi:hypothetical protein
MDILKSTSKSSDSPKQPDTERRSFMWKLGAAMSAVLASAVAGISMKPRVVHGAGLNAQVDQLSNQLGILEDANAIRRLHQTYETYLDKGMYKEVVNLFADDGVVVFNGGIFMGKDRGVMRLYCDHFSSGLTGKRIEPAPGFQPDTEQQEDIIEVSPDRRSARARFAYSIQVGAPIISDLQLVKMVRLHGEGIMKWWEGGTYEVSYVRDTKNSTWKIKRLEYRVQSKADFRPGKSYARPISVPTFSNVYPEDPAGPDKLIHPAQGLRKG